MAKRPEDRFYFGEVNEILLAQLYSTTGWFTMCSEGGDMYAMTAAIDRLRTHPLNVRVTGACFSAAVPILALGKKREATENTRFLVHRASQTEEGRSNLLHMRRCVEELERLEDLYFRILGVHTTTGREAWLKLADQNTYFGAEEALTAGLIDRII